MSNRDEERAAAQFEAREWLRRHTTEPDWRALAEQLAAALEEVQRDVARAAVNNVVWPSTRRNMTEALKRYDAAKK